MRNSDEHQVKSDKTLYNGHFLKATLKKLAIYKAHNIFTLACLVTTFLLTLHMLIAK